MFFIELRSTRIARVSPPLRPNPIPPPPQPPPPFTSRPTPFWLLSTYQPINFRNSSFLPSPPPPPSRGRARSPSPTRPTISGTLVSKIREGGKRPAVLTAPRLYLCSRVTFCHAGRSPGFEKTAEESESGGAPPLDSTSQFPNGSRDFHRQAEIHSVTLVSAPRPPTSFRL
jgi:hypothetical protein